MLQIGDCIQGQYAYLPFLAIGLILHRQFAEILERCTYGIGNIFLLHKQPQTLHLAADT